MNTTNLNISTADNGVETADRVSRNGRRLAGGSRIVVDVRGASTSKEVMQAAGLDWKVVERALSDCDKDTGEDCRGIFTDKSLRRADTLGHLGIVGKNYCTLQNDQVFDFMDGLVKEGLVKFTGAGAFHGGRTIFVQARMGDDIEVAAGDVIQPYLLLSNSHDGSGSVHLCYTDLRVWCENKLALALKKAKRKIAMRHSSAFSVERLAIAKKIIDEGTELRKAHVEVLKTLAKTSAGDTAALTKFFIESLGIKPTEEGTLAPKSADRLAQAFDAFENSPGNSLPSVRGSRWAALNAVTYLVDHKAGTRLPKDTPADQREFLEEHNRLESAMFGAGAKIKGRALELSVASLN